MNAINQQQLLEYINALSLTMTDTNLFLDTHPDNCEALEYFCKIKMLYQQAKKEYAMRFGSLTTADVNCQESWNWINEPWPWERRC